MSDRFTHDPDATLDYRWDWKSLTNGYGYSDWLGSEEIITSHTITADSGITVDSSALASTSTAVVAWISGGTAGTNYNVTCHIVTSQGREDDRTIRLMVRQR